MYREVKGSLMGSLVESHEEELRKQSRNQAPHFASFCGEPFCGSCTVRYCTVLYKSECAAFVRQIKLLKKGMRAAGSEATDTIPQR